MIANTIDFTGRDQRQVALTPEEFGELESRMHGNVLQFGDDGWDDAILIWNAMVHNVPALIVQPGSAQEVAAAVVFARDHGLLLSIKGGGHNIAGTSMADGGMTIDMSRLRDITVDPEARLVHAGAGCLLQDVDQATQEHGMATVLGIMSEVGIAGLTLGGGFGYLARRFGWAVDNLERVEIVTADGEIRTASRAENADLFWAIRGGGGNFGVVTRFTYRLHAVGPMVTGGLIAWDAARLDQILLVYQELTESVPRELTAVLVVLTAPPAPFVPAEWHGRPVVGMMVCDSGANPDADLALVRAVGNPIFDLIGEMPYVAQQRLINDMDPKGLNQYWKTGYLPGMSAGFNQAFADVSLGMVGPHSYSIIFHIGGALNDRAEDDGAVGNRDATYIAGYSAVWTPDEQESGQIAWARAAGEAIAPFTTGSDYVNFLQTEDDDARTAQVYRTNYSRLRELKRKFDPTNLFRVNRNIQPAP